MSNTQPTQFSMDSSLAVVYHGGRNTTSADSVVFECDVPKIFRIKTSITIEELKQKIRRKLGAGSRIVADLYYRCVVSVGSGRVQYMRMTLLNDGDIQRMWEAFNDHSSHDPIELYVVLGRTDDEIIAKCRALRTADEIIALLRQP